MSAPADTALASDPLGILMDARRREGETFALASLHLDPSLVDVLAILGFDRRYTAARGSHLYDEAGRAYLDMHTGEGFASLGHNHPDVREVLRATLAADLIDGVQIHYSPLAGMLAEALCERLPAPLDAVFFASTGAEAVDSAMKFARAATGRPRLISCESRSTGSPWARSRWSAMTSSRRASGRCSRAVRESLSGISPASRRSCTRGDVAAFIVEPIQGREVTLPPAGYLRAAQDLCRRHGTLFVLDEVQTGLGRAGRWFALEHWEPHPTSCSSARL